jgi:pyruvate/2-oxoglutarate dehydrogenase complex dihydrolipoamide acyltransferase (E2) component
VGAREETIPLTNMRRLIAEHMLRSRRTSAHVTAFAEVDMTRVVQLRERARAEFERRTGIKLTYMPFVAMATIRALRDFPIVNSTMTEDAITVKHYVNLGIAVALEDGLIVPVVKNADEKNLHGLAREIDDLAHRARERRLTPDDIAGGTFTITNPGSFGTILGTPIINQPQAAILDMEAIVKRPVVVTNDGVDSIAIRSIVYLGLSFDHRVIDGAVAAQFLGKVKQYLEAAEFDV